MVTLGLANGARAHTTVRILWEGLVELTVSKKWCGALRYSLMSHVHSEFTRYRDGNYSFVFVASGVPGALPSFQHLKPFDSSVPAVTWYFAHSSTANTQSNDVSLVDYPRYYSRRWKLIEGSKRLVRPIID